MASEAIFQTCNQDRFETNNKNKMSILTYWRGWRIGCFIRGGANRSKRKDVVKVNTLFAAWRSWRQTGVLMKRISFRRHSFRRSVIGYRSRHDDDEICYGIFDRAHEKLTVEMEQPDLHQAWIWPLLTKYRKVHGLKFASWPYFSAFGTWRCLSAQSPSEVSQTWLHYFIQVRRHRTPSSKKNKYRTSVVLLQALGLPDR